jgi:hypothetical protein
MTISASLYRRPENIRVLAVVIPELELGDVQMQILLADAMVGPNEATLQHRPEAFNGLSVDRANDVFVRPMINSLVGKAVLGQSLISRPLICAEEANFVRDRFIDESSQCRALHILDDAGNDIPLATDCADDNGLALFVALPAPLVPMPIAAIASDNSLINFDDPAKLADVLNHSGSDFVTHEPSGLVRAEAHIAEDLKGAHSLLADQHQVRDAEPIPERFIRIFKNRSGKVRKAIAGITARGALRTLPMPNAAMEFIHSRVAAARAYHAVRPTPNDKVLDAVVLSPEQRVKLRCGHFLDGLRLLLTAHGGSFLIAGAKWHV